MLTAYSLLILFSVVGFFALFFTTFGTFLIVLGVGFFSFMTQFQIISIPTLVFIIILYIVGEILEYVLMILGAKRLGASNWAVAGAILGGIVGALMGPFFFGVGIIVTTLCGIFLGAFLLEILVKGDWKQSLKSATGSILGRIGSILAKLIISFIILGTVAYRIYLNLSVY